MGQSNSKDLNKFQISFSCNKDNKVINTKAYKINKALNVYYIYFRIKDYSINYILNSDIELYISNICDINSNLTNEDTLKMNMTNNTTTNIIDKKKNYDIEYSTTKSKKVIFRSFDQMMKSFDIVYIM
jgi:hypothetical protein|tara:strand:+ start:3939 stop:4322 length:384 start_codon:yes stop_codon:yes gene_type:complete